MNEAWRSGAAANKEVSLLLDDIIHNLRIAGAVSVSQYFTSRPSASGCGTTGTVDVGVSSGQAKIPSPEFRLSTSNPTMHTSTSNGPKASIGSEPLPPLPPEPKAGPASTATEDRYSMQIEECCMEWRAGLVKPYWLIFTDAKQNRSQGCALRVQISANAYKVYSVDATYEDAAQAKAACAKVAVDQGVLDFIMFGGDQKSPTIKMGPRDGQVFTGEDIWERLADQNLWTVSSFYEALPKTCPELQTKRSPLEINGPAWLNTALQTTRGSKLKANFIWIGGTISPLHGCLLRLERPNECKSYLVDARFQKRAEAKHAVCLLAMSEGAGAYVRAVAKEVDARLSPATRKLVNEVLGPTLLEECRRLGPNNAPIYDYQHDGDACGCTMSLQLVINPAQTQQRTYFVPPEYRNRNDAKTAVVALAVEQGAIEFLRFRGTAPPLDYVPAYSGHWNVAAVSYSGKRKNPWEPADGGGKRVRFNEPQGPSQGVRSFAQALYTTQAFSGYVGAGMPWPPSYSPATPPTYPYSCGPGNTGSSHYTYSAHTPSIPNTSYLQASNNTYPASSGAAYSQPFQPYFAPPASMTTLVTPFSSMQHPIGPGPSQISAPAYSPSQPLSPLPTVANVPVVPTAGPSAPASSGGTSQWAKKAKKPNSKSSPGGAKKNIRMKPAPKSCVTELYDYCAAARLPTPQFFNDFVTTAPGQNQHKVWVVIGKQRHELPVSFGSLSQGQEHIARKALDHLQSQSPFIKQELSQ